MPKSPEHLTLTRKQERLIEASGADPRRPARAHRLPAHRPVPVRHPLQQPRRRRCANGTASRAARSLRIEAGSAIDPRTGEFVKLGLPYGEKPRLVLIHLASEAVRNGSPWSMSRSR